MGASEDEYFVLNHGIPVNGATRRDTDSFKGGLQGLAIELGNSLSRVEFSTA